MGEEPYVQHDEDQVDDRSAEKDRVEVAEHHMVNEDRRKGCLPVDAQSNDIDVPIEIPIHVLIADTEHEGEGEPSLKEGEVVGRR